MRRFSRLYALLAVVLILAGGSGCRYRTTALQAEPYVINQTPTAKEPLEPQLPQEKSLKQKEPPKTQPPQTEPPRTEPKSEVNAVEQEDTLPPPAHDRKEAREDPLAPETAEVDSEDARQSGTEDSPVIENADNIDHADESDEPDISDDLVVLPVIVDAEEQITLDNDEGGAIGLILDQYTDLLDHALVSLYPCQESIVYIETTTEYLTAGRGTAENSLIRESGGQNVADILRSDALNVDDDWVIRKNPGTIVKIVPPNVLGREVADTTLAAHLYAGIRARNGWDTLNVVMNRNVLLISAELLDTDEGRLYAKLCIAGMMYPTLFADIDISEYRELIFGEGNGIYVYSE